MMQYIQDRFRDPLSLDEIAASASVSKSRALQIFQDHIQVSPIAYLISYRLQRAAFLLSETEKPISSIAEETGFSDSRLFLPDMEKALRHDAEGISEYTPVNFTLQIQPCSLPGILRCPDRSADACHLL